EHSRRRRRPDQAGRDRRGQRRRPPAAQRARRLVDEHHRQRHRCERQRRLAQYNGISKIDVVSIESVGEVQIVKGVIPAEYGMAMAGNLNIITKSGTNAPHGSLFTRYEGDSLSARSPLLKVEPPSKWNQYGGSYGG